jgi:hypothetical protein
MVFAKCAECKNLINRGFYVECGKGLSPFSCVQEPINVKEPIIASADKK